MAIKETVEILFSYLLTSFIDFCKDNSFTPFIIIYAREINNIPKQVIRDDGYVILNISHVAAYNLRISYTDIKFQVGFNGNPVALCVPLKSVHSAYIKEHPQINLVNSFHLISEIDKQDIDVTANESKTDKPPLEIQKENNVTLLSTYRDRKNKKD
jgi:stringent starvation protein B